MLLHGASIMLLHGAQYQNNAIASGCQYYVAVQCIVKILYSIATLCKVRVLMLLLNRACIMLLYCAQYCCIVYCTSIMHHAKCQKYMLLVHSAQCTSILLLLHSAASQLHSRMQFGYCFFKQLQPLGQQHCKNIQFLPNNTKFLLL